MNAAEKRAELEARGAPWPTCDCHGEPLLWRTDKTRKGGGRFRCRIYTYRLQNTTRQKRRDVGLCVQCGGSLETDSMCAPCADRHNDAAWRYMQKPEAQLGKFLDNMMRRNRRRVSEGFQPTGAGRAAAAAWMKGAGHDPSDE